MSKELELVKEGYANGVAPGFPLTEDQKWEMVDKAAEKYGEFLTALGCDWENDPNSNDTPRRVAKAYVFDLWKGRYEAMSNITAFPSDGYDGIVQESNIPIESMCSHHHQRIGGRVSIAYVPSKDGKVIGLSKLNRIVDLFGRRGAIQEQLTVAIHNSIDTIINDNKGVAVMIDATHNCVSCRGVKHGGASMKTSKLTGAFKNDPATKKEFIDNVKLQQEFSCGSQEIL